MAILTANFEAGINGNTITTDWKEGSATPFSVVNGTLTYDKTHVAHGTLAAKYDGTLVNCGIRWPDFSVSDTYFRLYAYYTAFPTSQSWIVTTVGGPFIGALSTGKMQIADSTGATRYTFTNSIALNQYIRIEGHFNTTSFDVRLYNDRDNSSATEIGTDFVGTYSTNIRAEVGTASAHAWSAWGSDFWIDEIVFNADTWVGPIVKGIQTPSLLLPSSGLRW